jgi:redox-sensitive bicupin YhaK (pirin superfamily)
MAEGGAPSRELRVVASHIDLEDVSGRVLFPTPAQGPWMPFARFAETVSTGGRTDTETHSHLREEVANYVLEGRVEYEDDLGRRSILEPGTVALFTARDEARHNLVPNLSPRARWCSVIVRCPPTTTGPSHRVQIAPAPGPVPGADGIIQRPLVGLDAPVASSCGLECLDLQFSGPGRWVGPLGRKRRAVAYVLDGRSRIDDHPVDAGAGALIESAMELLVVAEAPARLLIASAPFE